MSELFSKSRQPNKETAEEILDRLEKNNNYISPSARQEYKNILLNEYKDYVASRKNQTSMHKIDPESLKLKKSSE